MEPFEKKGFQIQGKFSFGTEESTAPPAPISDLPNSRIPIKRTSSYQWTVELSNSRARKEFMDQAFTTNSAPSEEGKPEEQLGLLGDALQRLTIGKRKRAAEFDAHSTKQEEYLMKHLDQLASMNINGEIIEVAWAPGAKEKPIESSGASSTEFQHPLPDCNASSIRIKYEAHPDPIDIISNEFALLQLFADLAQAKSGAIAFVNSDQNVEKMFKYVFETSPEERRQVVVIDRKTPEHASWFIRDYFSEIPMKLVRNIAPHVASESWSDEFIRDLILKMKSDDFALNNDNKIRQIEAFTALLRLIGLDRAEKVIKVIQSYGLDFVNILGGCIWLVQIELLICELLDPTRPGSSTWIELFDLKFPNMIMEAIRRFSFDANAEDETHLGDLAVYNIRFLVESVLHRLKDTNMGRFIRSREFISPLSRICVDAGLRPYARSHVMSMLRSVLSSFKIPATVPQDLPDALDAFSGADGSKFFVAMSPLFHSGDISQVEDATNLLLVLAELRMREIKECMRDSGLFEIAMETTFRKVPDEQALHCSGSLLFEEFLLSSGFHLDIAVGWIESSVFLHAVAADVETQSGLSPADRAPNYPYLLKIIFCMNELRRMHTEVRRLLENKGDGLHRLISLLPTATQGLQEQNTWESSVESPRKRRVCPALVDQLNESIRLEQMASKDSGLDPEYPSDFDDDDPITSQDFPSSQEDSMVFE
eukprot:TRINITY_DN1302_c0_g1_i4.p1 TRINITY_DN1302_c0_g1~~TRINITY_DN1302_c0_g1_i4.p1  ORF type:complete len:708 (+),score=118.73 TRINITY_DN1302_c0_g1_i4:4464-6587(+)